MSIPDFDANRLASIRAGLVEKVASRRRRRIPVWAAVAVFALAGALTGGAVSAAAITRSDSPSIFPSKDMFLGLLRGGHTVGPLITRAATGSTQLDLGPRPDDATGIVINMRCEGSGGVLQTLGGEAELPQQCVSGDIMGFSTDTDPANSTVSIEAGASMKYAIWAQWFTTPAPAKPSAAQQAAVADGVITEAEWHDAVDRFAACMNGAGYPLLGYSYDPFSYSLSSDAERTGAVERCQESELNEVEKIWDASSH